MHAKRDKWRGYGRLYAKEECGIKGIPLARYRYLPGHGFLPGPVGVPFQAFTTHFHEYYILRRCPLPDPDRFCGKAAPFTNDDGAVWVWTSRTSAAAISCEV